MNMLKKQIILSLVAGATITIAPPVFALDGFYGWRGVGHHHHRHDGYRHEYGDYAPVIVVPPPRRIYYPAPVVVQPYPSRYYEPAPVYQGTYYDSRPGVSVDINLPRIQIR